MDYIDYKPNELWNNFISSFKENITELWKEKDLQKNLWDNKPEMTRFYKEKLFRKIAIELELELAEKEYLRIDMMLYKKKKESAYEIPIIFIESENDSFGDLPNEIYKLLCVNAPLKILMTRNSFEKDLKEKNKLEDTYWKYVLEDFAHYDRLVGYFGVISAVLNEQNKLYYQYIVYDEKAKIVGEIQKISLE